MSQPTPDDLRQFYSTPLGALTCRALRERLHDFWPEVGAGTRLDESKYIAGLGHTRPYFMPMLDKIYDDDPPHGYHLMPLSAHADGVRPWPAERPNSQIVGDLHHLPWADESIHRVLGVHVLEHADRAHHVLREIWRVLEPEGRLLLVAPNRTSPWARNEHTPFGTGQPYSLKQITRLLEGAMFDVQHHQMELFFAPTQSHLGLKIYHSIAPMIEKCCPMLGGVIIVEAKKTLYAGTPARVHDGKPSVAKEMAGAIENTRH